MNDENEKTVEYIVTPEHPDYDEVVKNTIDCEPWRQTDENLKQSEEELKNHFNGGGNDDSKRDVTFALIFVVATIVGFVIAQLLM